MSIEDYIAALQQIATEHPGARMIATFDGSETQTPADYEAHPAWNERDGWVDVDVDDQA